MTQETPVKKNKKIGRWILLVLGIILVFFLFTGKASIIALYQSHRDIQAKKALLAKRHREINSLKSENANLKYDTLYMEKIAREKLGMARKDETVYKFISDSN